MADKEITFNKDDIAPDRITIQTSITHQDLEEHNIASLSSGKHFHLQTKEQPFERKVVLEGPIDLKTLIDQGWIKDPGLIVVTYRPIKSKVTLSPEEQKAEANKVILLDCFFSDPSGEKEVKGPTFKLRPEIPFYFELDNYDSSMILSASSYPAPLTINIFSK